MLFLTSLESIVPIIALIVLGYFLQVKGLFHNDFGNDLSKLIMNVAMPVSIFVSVLKYLTLEKLISLSGGLIYTFIAFALGYIVAFLSVKAFKVAPGRRGTVINTFVNANTIFIGLPLNIALFGDDALAYFLIYYITNTISTWTLGVFLMTSDSKDGKKKQESHFDWKRLLPAPLLGFIVSSTLGYIGGLTTPLSLVYIGIVLAKAGIKTIRFDKDSIVALIGRFIVAPVLMFLVLKLMAPGMVNAEYQTFMIQSATPALAVLPILANQGDGDVEFATNIVTLSTVLFVIVIPILQTIIG